MDRRHSVERILIGTLAMLFAACQPSTQPPPPPAPAAPAEIAPALVPPPPSAMPAADAPPGPLYYCDVGGTRTPVEFDARVDQLCRRHPQMGPCQYERDACRKRGGRVFTARDEEVTPAVEAEYDRVVRRVRLQADGGPPSR
jgi:hypothetical protein